MNINNFIVYHKTREAGVEKQQLFKGMTAVMDALINSKCANNSPVEFNYGEFQNIIPEQ